MTGNYSRKILLWLGLALGLWLGLRFVLPVALPFLLAGALALISEPLVRSLQKRLHLPRAAATGVGVSICLLMAVLIFLTVCAFLLRQLRSLADVVPDLEGSAAQGIASLEEFFLVLAGKAPQGLRPVLTHSVENLFSGSSRILDRVSGWLLNIASGVLKALPDSALGLGTWILAAYMTSAKLPKIKQFLATQLPQKWTDRYLPALKRLRHSLALWLTAQLKLTGITFAVLAVGFFMLRIPYGIAWAALICLVDALPILGTGTVLIPWSLVSFLQGDHLQAVGLLSIYGVAALLRCVLEPRLVGKHLGLDPLLTLFSLYAGYHLWGIFGMLLAPLLTVTVTQLLRKPETDRPNR
ncbi:MAG: sporulation integral membrane protein YtvI [Oscillospiraceae bacterium]|nr:sporulation integral membrane protein YtvI [Oscillospiraceae bacterium]